MKKTIAVASAAFIGMVGAVATGSSAQAADTVTVPGAGNECTTSAQHFLSTTADGTQGWYMDCIPQYGMGKAEFTITSENADHPTRTFPTGFTLTDSATTTTTTTDDKSAIAAYFTPSMFTGAFTGFASKSTTDPAHSLAYQGYVALPVISVVHTDISKLPAACTSAAQTYTGVYAINFKPVTTTFTKTISGIKWKYKVTATPHTLFLGLNFASGNFTDAPQCAATAGASLYAGGIADGANYFTITNDNATLDGSNTLDPFVGPFLSSADLGIIAPAADPPVAGPSLALTGINAAPAEWLGGGLIAAGLLFLGLRFAGFGRRRRHAQKQH
ncbi:MAG: hypothetical protein JWQ39_1145 [Glaciihabitans sp.]|nr:hypothetical protein [Glaciihabitans sp.]